MVVVASGVLTAEPGDEPVATVDVKFSVPLLLQGAGESVELELAVADGLVHHDGQGRHGAVGDDGFFGGEGTCAEGFDLLVTGGGDNGETFGQTSDLGGFGGDVAEDTTLLDEVKHLITADAEDFIDKVVLEPVFGGIVEGEEAALHASGIGSLSGELKGEVTGQGAVVGSLLVGLWLVVLQPIELGVGGDVFHKATSDAGDDAGLHGGLVVNIVDGLGGLALIEPDDPVTHGLQVFIQRHDVVAVCCNGERANVVLFFAHVVGDFLEDHLAVVPHLVGGELGPTGLLGVIRLRCTACLGDDVSMCIENDDAAALRADVNNGQIVFAHL